MTDSAPSCSEGWDPRELLAYLEGDLAPEARAELEAHVRTCEVCAGELASLRRMDTLLRHRTPAFHPDEEALQRFVLSGEDTDGKIATHLATCQPCAEDVELLREMARLGSAVAAPRPVMPTELVRQIERLHPAHAPESLVARLVASVREFFALPFRVPMFALGTAVAAVIVIVVLIPRYEKRVEAPPSAPRALFEQPVPPAERKAGVPRTEGTPTYGMAPIQAPLTGKAKDGETAQDNVAASPQALQKPAAPPADSDKERLAASSRMKRDKRVAPQEAPPVLARKPEAVTQERRAFEGSVEPQAPAASAPSRQEPAEAPVVAKARKKAEPAPGLAASAEKEAAAPKAHPAGTADARTPVTLRVVDADGRDVSWIEPALPKELAGRYRLVHARDEERPPESGWRASGKPADLGFSDSDKRGISLLIRLRQHGDVFDLDAKRLDPLSGRETKRIEAIGVARPDLQDRIDSLVASLLE